MLPKGIWKVWAIQKSLRFNRFQCAKMLEFLNIGFGWFGGSSSPPKKSSSGWWTDCAPGGFDRDRHGNFKGFPFLSHASVPKKRHIWQNNWDFYGFLMISWGFIWFKYGLNMVSIWFQYGLIRLRILQASTFHQHLISVTSSQQDHVRPYESTTVFVSRSPWRLHLALHDIQRIQKEGRHLSGA